MDAVAAFCPRFRLPSFSASNQPNLGKTFFSLKEIADGPSLFACRKDFAQLNVLSIRADGNSRGQPPQKKMATGRTSKRGETKTSQSSESRSSKNSNNPEEIIALFRRIQSLASKGDYASPKVINSDSSLDKPAAESVLEVLRQSRKLVKGEKTSNKEGSKSLTWRSRLLQKERNAREDPSVADLKLTRPPSNFVKRSPIPIPSSQRKKLIEQKIEVCSATNSEEIESQKLEEMKVSDLKELAKTRGIKGYSKLKKSELVEVLKS